MRSNECEARALIAKQMDISPSRLLLWEFNAMTAQTVDTAEFCRMYACLGKPSLVEWSWLDRRIRLPIYKALAKILNKTVALAARFQS